MNSYQMKPQIIYGGNGQVLANEIYRHLYGAGGRLPINADFELGKMNLGRFPCGEPDVQIASDVRERNVYIVVCCKDRAFDALELCVLNDAAKRAHAGKIIDVIANYPFGRQDRKAKGREPITAKLYARMLEVSGATKVCIMDLHAGQIQGFFEIPCDNLEPALLFGHDIGITYKGFENVTFVAPDEGAMKRIKDITRKIGDPSIPVAMVNKRRVDAKTVKVESVVGAEYIGGRHAVFIDDEIDTAGTAEKDADALMDLPKPPISLSFYATHGTFSDPATERLERLARDYKMTVVVTDTIPQEPQPWKRVISTGPLFAHALDRIQRADSVSALFERETFMRLLYPND